MLLALALATKQIPELLVDIPMSRMPKLNYQYDDGCRDVVLASQSTEQVTFQLCGCKLNDDQNKRHVTYI